MKSICWGKKKVLLLKIIDDIDINIYITFLTRASLFLNMQSFDLILLFKIIYSSNFV